MPENRTESPDLLRPVFILDHGAFLSYSSYIRRILVGLAGIANASGLVCPSDVDLESILYPSVEWIEHPALRMPLFKHQNRRILVQKLADFKPTIMHAFHPGLVPLTRWLSSELEIPYVVTFHGEPGRWINFDNEPCSVTKLIAPSEFILWKLKDKWPSLNERMELIDIGTFVEDRCSCFSRPAGVASLVSIHPFKKMKTFIPLLNAIRHLILDGYEIFVALMGSGPAENTIRRHIRQLGLSSVVTVVPPIRPVRNILSGADIYLHVEDQGVFDAQLLEAMAVGLAVIGAADKTSSLQGGFASCIWDPKDELSIYACLKQSLTNRDGTRLAALNAQSTIRKSNSVTKMVDRLIQTYMDSQKFYAKNCRLSAEQKLKAEIESV